MYYWISRTEDGECFVYEYNKKQLLEELNEYSEEYSSEDFIEKLERNDMMYWNKNNLIIKGNIVSPIAEEKIMKFNIK